MHRKSNETRCIGVAFVYFSVLWGELSGNQITTKINNKKTREKMSENSSYLYNFNRFAFVVFNSSNIRHCRLCLLVGLLPSIFVPLCLFLFHCLSLYFLYLVLFSLVYVMLYHFSAILCQKIILYISVNRECIIMSCSWKRFCL